MIRKLGKRILSLLFIVVFTFSSTSVAFATNKNEKVSSTESKTETVYNQGECPSNGAITIKFNLYDTGLFKKLTVNARSESPTGMLILLLYDPNGKLRSNDWLMGVNEVATWDFFWPPEGEWKLEVAAQGTYDKVTVTASW